MSDAHDVNSENRRAARDALLDAIRKEVEQIDPKEQRQHRIVELRQLADAYALVVHGRGIDSTQRKS
ncbi:hypothetical protein RM863_29260 [Streptomyces sp. DSM 41014]|uniref:Uncharacterized protein n=1 Tax=Streptomyces hintoniae TaxID=3075521 RepID=A0ABU2UTM5_9ACTN|nr:hypothetical protein [Streptomyces sp. DSM 41014]MDT0476221.1 hypothetical protein [Streptomyces sp. DSM 41014]